MGRGLARDGRPPPARRAEPRRSSRPGVQPRPPLRRPVPAPRRLTAAVPPGSTERRTAPRPRGRRAVRPGRRLAGDDAHRPAHPFRRQRRHRPSGGARPRRGRGRADDGRPDRPRHLRRGRRGGRGGAAAGVEVVPGVEISCAHEGISLHLLGYWPDRRPPGARRRAAAQPRRPRPARRRRSSGGWPRPATRSPGPTWRCTCPTVRRSAARTSPTPSWPWGSSHDRDAAFATLLHDGSPFYATHHATDPVEAVRLVTAAGGVTVFAHPGAGRRGRLVADDVVATLAAAGLAGLEVDHPDHDAAARARYGDLARSLGLLATGFQRLSRHRQAPGSRGVHDRRPRCSPRCGPASRSGAEWPSSWGSRACPPDCSRPSRRGSRRGSTARAATG